MQAMYLRYTQMNPAQLHRALNRYMQNLAFTLQGAARANAGAHATMLHIPFCFHLCSCAVVCPCVVVVHGLLLTLFILLILLIVCAFHTQGERAVAEPSGFGFVGCSGRESGEPAWLRGHLSKEFPG